MKLKTILLCGAAAFIGFSGARAAEPQTPMSVCPDVVVAQTLQVKNQCRLIAEIVDSHMGVTMVTRNGITIVRQAPASKEVAELAQEGG